MNNLVFLFLCFFPVLLFAQDYRLSGHVCDSISGNVLQGANVVFFYCESGQQAGGTATNADGDFTIRIDTRETYLISVSFIGYQPTKFRLGMNNLPPGRIEIRLSPVVTVLNEVMVVWKPLIEYGDDGSTALNLDMLGNVEGLSAADALEMIPGFYFDSDDKPIFKGSGDFTILTNGEKNSGILIGAGISKGTALYTLRSIPAKYIRRVEIIPEPMGKYGFFTPVINLITKGELMDVYNAGASVSTPKKYAVGLDFSKKIGKIRLMPSLSYSESKIHTQTDEKMFFTAAETLDYSRRTDRNEKLSQGQASLEATCVSGAENRIAFGLSGTPVNSDKTSQTRSSFSSATGKNSLNEEYYSSRPQNWGSSFSLSRMFCLGRTSSLRLLASFGHRYTQKDEQQQTSTEYLQKYLQQNTTAKFNTGYSLQVQKLYTAVNIGYDYQNNYNFSDRLELIDGKSASLPAYFRDKRLQRSTTSVDMRGNRRLGKAGTMLRLGFSGTWNLDRISDYRTEETSSEDHFRLSGFAGYNGYIFKQRISFGYQYQVSSPTSTQLMATPVYINQNTIRVGNPDLKPELGHSFSFSVAQGYQPGTVTMGKEMGGSQPVGYTLNLDYNLLFNNIENSRIITNDSVVTFTFANSSKKRSFNFSGSLFYHYRNKFRIQVGESLGIENFFDNKLEKQSGNNWSVFTKLRMKVLSQGNLELKYGYNSPKIAYQSKIHGSHDASVAFSRNFLKNNLMIQLELSDLLRMKGIRTEYFGGNFYSNTVVKNETPVLAIRINYLLFSFYNRESLE